MFFYAWRLSTGTASVQLYRRILRTVQREMRGKSNLTHRISDDFVIEVIDRHAGVDNDRLRRDA